MTVQGTDLCGVCKYLNDGGKGGGGCNGKSTGGWATRRISVCQKGREMGGGKFREHGGGA